MQPGNEALKRQQRERERGVAIFIVVFALLLLSAIAFALIYSTNTEIGVNWNYRQEDLAYFASRAGMEEVRDRMGIGAQVPPGPGGIAPAPVPPAACATPPMCLPPAPPDQPGGYVLYLINQGTDPTPVQPWDAGTKYMDDELCHDGYNMSGWPGVGNVPAPGVRCQTVPSGNGWWQTVPSDLTNVIGWGAGDALLYKWVRVTMKENSSVAYGDPAAGGLQTYYSVNSNPALPASQTVCYDGVTERVLPVGVSTCACWAWPNPNATPCATPPVPPPVPVVYANPVYLITAMGITGSGARRVIQAEVGLAPTPPLPDGLFSTSPNCNSLQFVGNAYTDSFNSANGTYAQTVTASGGDIGSLGNIGMAGNANIQGTVNVTGTTYTPTVGPCNAVQNNGVTGSGNNWRDQGLQALPPNYNTAAAFPPPPAPNPPPPTTTTTYTTSTTLPPGNYGNINVSNGTLTLTPGVYNINSITASGLSNITVSPAGQVVINIGGNGALPTCTLASGATASCVVSLTGQNITNPSGISNDFTINYSGNGVIQLAGKGVTYVVVDAPNAALNMSGNGQFFGAVLGNTIYYSGNGAFHYDKNAAFQPKANQNYTMLSLRVVSY